MISGHANIFDTANIYGDAKISGHAKVIEGNWGTSPIYIQGPQHAITVCGPNKLAIGCEVRTINDWAKNYKTVGEQYHYTKEEITIYKEYIFLIRKLMKSK